MRIKRILLLSLALVVAALLQSTLGARLTLFAARFDLVLVLVVTYSVLQGSEEGLLAGLIGGLVVDNLSVVPFGTTAIALGLAGLLTGLGDAALYRANFVIPLTAVGLATVFYHSFILLALQAAGWSVDWTATLALQTIPGALMNALLAALIFSPMQRLVVPPPVEGQLRW